MGDRSSEGNTSGTSSKKRKHLDGSKRGQPQGKTLSSGSKESHSAREANKDTENDDTFLQCGQRLDYDDSQHGTIIEQETDKKPRYDSKLLNELYDFITKETKIYYNQRTKGQNYKMMSDSGLWAYLWGKFKKSDILPRMPKGFSLANMKEKWSRHCSKLKSTKLTTGGKPNADELERLILHGEKEAVNAYKAMMKEPQNRQIESQSSCVPPASEKSELSSVDSSKETSEAHFSGQSSGSEYQPPPKKVMKTFPTTGYRVHPNCGNTQYPTPLHVLYTIVQVVKADVEESSETGPVKVDKVRLESLQSQLDECKFPAYYGALGYWEAWKKYVKNLVRSSKRSNSMPNFAEKEVLLYSGNEHRYESWVNRVQTKKPNKMKSDSQADAILEDLPQIEQKKHIPKESPPRHDPKGGSRRQEIVPRTSEESPPRPNPKRDSQLQESFVHILYESPPRHDPKRKSLQQQKEEQEEKEEEERHFRQLLEFSPPPVPMHTDDTTQPKKENKRQSSLLELGISILRKEHTGTDFGSTSTRSPARPTPIKQLEQTPLPPATKPSNNAVNSDGESSSVSVQNSEPPKSGSTTSLGSDSEAEKLSSSPKGPPAKASTPRGSPAKELPAKALTFKGLPANESPPKELPAKASTSKELPAKESTPKKSPAKASTSKELPAKESTPKKSPIGVPKDLPPGTPPAIVISSTTKSSTKVSDHGSTPVVSTEKGPKEGQKQPVTQYKRLSLAGRNVMFGEMRSIRDELNRIAFTLEIEAETREEQSESARQDP